MCKLNMQIDRRCFISGNKNYQKGIENFFREHENEYSIVHVHIPNAAFVVLKYAKRYGVKIATETFGDAVKYSACDFFGNIEEFEKAYKAIKDIDEFKDTIKNIEDIVINNINYKKER